MRSQIQKSGLDFNQLLSGLFRQLLNSFAVFSGQAQMGIQFVYSTQALKYIVVFRDSISSIKRRAAFVSSSSVNLETHASLIKFKNSSEPSARITELIA